MSATQSPSLSRSLRALIQFSWLLTLAFLLALLLHWFWPHHLQDKSRTWLVCSYFVFMAETFLAHAALALLLPLLFAILIRRWRLAALCSICILAGLWPHLTQFFTSPAPASTTQLRVLSINMLYGSSDENTVLTIVRREHPDILCIQEWTPAAHHRLFDKLISLLPYSKTLSDDSAFGQAVFSRIQPSKIFLFDDASRDTPQIIFDLPVNNRTIRVVNVHTLPPATLEIFAEQRALTSAYAQAAEHWLARSSPDPADAVVLAGDFNALWSSGHGHTLAAAELSDAFTSAGSGWGGTWPRVGPFCFFPGIALDHILFSPQLSCSDFRVLEETSSDHAPIFAALNVNQ